jgi:hypothetical protein
MVTMGFAPMALDSSCSSLVRDSLLPREAPDVDDEELSFRLFEFTCAVSSASSSVVVEREEEEEEEVAVLVARGVGGGDSTCFHEPLFSPSVGEAVAVNSPTCGVVIVVVASDVFAKGCDREEEEEANGVENGVENGVVNGEAWANAEAAGESTSVHVLSKSEGVCGAESEPLLSSSYLLLLMLLLLLPLFP